MDCLSERERASKRESPMGSVPVYSAQSGSPEEREGVHILLLTLLCRFKISLNSVHFSGTFLYRGAFAF